MEIISKEQFESAKEMKPAVKKIPQKKKLTKEEIGKIMTEMENPLYFQKELAAKIKISLDNQIDYEMEKRGILSDYTRRWVESYNKILEKIQSGIYGDRSVNLHLHKVSHGDVSDKIREIAIDAIIEKDAEKKSES